LLAARENTNRLIGEAVGADGCQRLSDLLTIVRRGAAEPPFMADQAQQHQVEAAQCQIGLQCFALRNVADLWVAAPRGSAEDDRRSRAQLQLAQSPAQERSFASPVRS